MAAHVLVTGGAGYIGSQTCKALARAGFGPVTFDSLSTDRTAVDAAFAEGKPVAVPHFAALSRVGEAMTDPGRDWRVTVGGPLNRVEAALAAGCRNALPCRR